MRRRNRAGRFHPSRLLKAWPLFLVVCVYTSFYLFWSPPAEHGNHGVKVSSNNNVNRDTPHEPTPTERQWFNVNFTTEPYKEFEVPPWTPSKFHPDLHSWKRCVKDTVPGFPWLHNATSNYGTRPVVIFTWHTLKNFLYPHEESVEKCPIPCIFASEFDTDDESCMEELDGLIFHPPTEYGKPDPSNKLPHQFWTLFTTETESNYPVLLDPEWRGKFDINMTYHLNDQVPFTYFIDMGYYFDFYKNLPKRTDAPVIAMVSNCDAKNGRNEYIQELSKYIKVHSYGKCFNNVEWPAELAGWTWWDSKWNVTSQYKFVIAFENSVFEDYVSEKLFHAFIIGTVPVYFGAPNVEEFLPAARSMININDFTGPKDLARYLKHLDQDDKAYEEYRTWKYEPPNENFQRLQRTSPRTGPCRLCMQIAAMQDKL